MADRNEIVDFANQFLKLADYPDYGPMGLQFTGSDEVTAIAAAVSVSADVIETAAKRGAQMLLVHHGLFWNNESRILDERLGNRLDLLEGFDMNLLAYHLALDAHPHLGNNYNAAKGLGLTDIEPFGEIGWKGKLAEPMLWKDFKNTAFGLFHSVPFTYPFGNLYVENVAVIVGGAPQYLVEAHRSGCDTFLTGEVGEPTLYTAKELRMNFMACGHHATEKSGVKKLASRIGNEFRIKSFFIDVDNQR